jgi:hypothetical protein
MRALAKTKGVSEKETLKQSIEDNLRTMEQSEAKFKTLEKRSRT